MAVTNTTITPTIGLEITGMIADHFGDPQTARDARRDERVREEVGRRHPEKQARHQLRQRASREEADTDAR